MHSGGHSAYLDGQFVYYLLKAYLFEKENGKKSGPSGDFIKENPSHGNLRVRAYTASGALPVSGLKVIVSTEFENSDIIFYEGVTNESGLIEKISLPAPKLIADNLDIPNKTTYDVLAIYEKENLNKVYKVNMYEDVCVVQNINVAPDTPNVGDIRWL